MQKSDNHDETRGFDDRREQVVSRQEFEAELIKQEHRLFKILKGYFCDRHKFSRDDPRHDAFAFAFWWRLAFALLPTAAVGGTGLAAIFGLYLANQSNRIMRDQTEIMLEDAQANLRMQLIEKLYQHTDPRTGDDVERDFPLPSADLGIAAYGHRVRAEALRSFVAMERRRLQNKQGQRIDVTYALLDHIDATGFDLSGVDLGFSSLIAAHLIDANLRNATLMNARLGGAALMRADLTGANLQQSDLIRSYLNDANLTNADLSGADLSGASLRNSNTKGTDFSNAVLIGAALEGCNLADANLSGVILHLVTDDGELPSHVSQIKNLGWTVSEAKTQDGELILVVEDGPARAPKASD